MIPKTILAVLAFVALFGYSNRAVAVETGEIRYISGTLPVPQETIGRFETTSDKQLIFRTSTEVRIPYSGVSKVESYRALARHLGVLPAIGAGLVRRRERKHFLELTFTDAAGVVQVALFEVPKDDPRVLLPILSARSPQACGGKGGCVEVDRD